MAAATRRHKAATGGQAATAAVAAATSISQFKNSFRQARARRTVGLSWVKVVHSSFGCSRGGGGGGGAARACSRGCLGTYLARGFLSGGNAALLLLALELLLALIPVTSLHLGLVPLQVFRRLVHVHLLLALI